MLLDMVKQNEMIKDEDIGPYLPNNASVQEYSIWKGKSVNKICG